MTSKNPAYPTAHPTAPGGMSQKALIEELVEKHGYPKQMVEELSWPRQIDAVAQGRLNREREADEAAGVLIIPESLEYTDDPADDTTMDALLAEITASLKDGPVETISTDEVPMPEGAPLFIGMPNSKDYIFDGHMGAGPSSSERWIECTASLAASRAFLETLTPNQQVEFSGANVAARQGTTAHAAAEVEALVVLGEMTAEEADLTLLELSVLPETDGEAYDDEMAEYITEYVDLVKQYAQERGDDHIMIEQTVEAVVELLTAGSLDGHLFVPGGDDSTFGKRGTWCAVWVNSGCEEDQCGQPPSAHGEPDIHTIRGSADFIALPTKTEPVLVVGDLKYGEGIDVDVDENPQVRIYALGALGLLTDDDGVLVTSIESVVYHIIQPRLGGIKTWTESVDDLLDWRDAVLTPKLTEALGGQKAGAAFSPTEVACQWCPARGTCVALIEQRTEQAAELFDVIVEAEFADGPGAFPETTGLSDERLGELLRQIEGLTKIHGDLRAEAQRRLYRGTGVPGYQLVSYTPPRKWKEGAAEELAPEDFDDPNAKLWKEPTLVSPTQAEKLLKEGYTKIEGWVDKPDKRPIIARVGDRRKTWEGRPPEAMFEDETGAGA